MALREIPKVVGPWSDAGIQLMNLLADLIWRGRHDDLSWHQLTSRFDYAARALAILCDRQLSARTASQDDNLILACIIAYRFHGYAYGMQEPMKKLKHHFQNNFLLREKAFWLDFALMRKIIPFNERWSSMFLFSEEGIVGDLVDTDIDWLMTTLSKQKEPERRVIALRAVIHHLAIRGQLEREIDIIHNFITDDIDLVQELNKYSRTYALG